MNRTFIIRTCLVAVAAVALNAFAATAQEEAGVITISDRVEQTSFAAKKAGCADGCTDAACCENAGTDCPGEGCCKEGCDTCNGAACANGACRPRRRWLRSGAGCPPAGCDNCNCNTGMCDGSCDGNCNGMCGYRRGYQRRMNRVLAQQCRQTRNDTEGGFWTRNARAYQARNARVSQQMFGWMVPAGNGGMGSSPFGHYDIVYAQNPNHVDPRDGGVYGAQGYGTHVTVPMAPNVRHAYNYGWGMPSSRISHISTVAPYTLPRPLHW